jgi:hypothetical protein
MYPYGVYMQDYHLGLFCGRVSQTGRMDRDSYPQSENTPEPILRDMAAHAGEAWFLKRAAQPLPNHLLG